jgi:predicted acyltransferase
MTSPELAPAPKRLLSSTLPRAAVAGMLLVDHQGSVDAAYPDLKHATWNGLTAADLVFPSFLFLVGPRMAWPVDGAVPRPRPERDTRLPPPFS